MKLIKFGNVQGSKENWTFIKAKKYEPGLTKEAYYKRIGEKLVKKEVKKVVEKETIKEEKKEKDSKKLD